MEQERDNTGSGFGKEGFDRCVQNKPEGLQTRSKERASRQLQLSAGPKEAWSMKGQMEGNGWLSELSGRLNGWNLVTDGRQVDRKGGVKDCQLSGADDLGWGWYPSSWR